MLGAVIGDIVGSPYEGARPKKEGWPLFSAVSRPTDDTVMTVAIARAFMDLFEQGGDLEAWATAEMRKFARLYPNVGYGTMFLRWAHSERPVPYGSYGNGSAMRVSPVGWLFDDPQTAEFVAELTARPTHGHPEGIKGARCVAACICLARTGASKGEIRGYVRHAVGYPLDFTLSEIAPSFSFDPTCQASVPVAVEVFLESSSYEETLRKAVSLGGDTDTIACIAGGIAEAAWGIPEHIFSSGLEKLDELLSSELRRWASCLPRMRDAFSEIELGVDACSASIVDRGGLCRKSP